MANNNEQQQLNITGVVPEIQEFLNQLLEDAGLGKADPTLKEMMVTDLSQRLNTQLLLTFAKNLNEQELDTFTKLAAVDQAQTMAYLHDVKPSLPVIILQAMTEFRNMFLEEEKK